MPAVTVSVLVPAPREAVWADLARLESHDEWMSDAESIEFLTDQRQGTGTRMRVATRVGPFRTSDVMEFVEWDPPTAMAVRHQGLFTGSGRFTLVPDREGTRFEWSERVVFPWYLGGPLGALVASPVLRLIWRKNLKRFAQRFE